MHLHIGKSRYISVVILMCGAAFSPPTTAQKDISPELKSQAMALAQMCRADFQRFCGNIQPGDGRILACFQDHMADLSPQCRDAIPQAKALATQNGFAPK